jgi:hypothetical protein
MTEGGVRRRTATLCVGWGIKHAQDKLNEVCQDR